MLGLVAQSCDHKLVGFKSTCGTDTPQGVPLAPVIIAWKTRLATCWFVIEIIYYNFLIFEETLKEILIRICVNNPSIDERKGSNFVAQMML